MRVPRALVAELVRLLEVHMAGHAESSCACSGGRSVEPKDHARDCHVRMRRQEYAAATKAVEKGRRLLEDPAPRTPSVRRVIRGA